MGLERLACVVQDVDSMFDVDTIRDLREHVCRIAGKEYGKEYKTDVSVRVITDHIRSVTFMISDGILPSNSGRGYVLRRLLRRACRHGRLLGIEGEFLVQLAQTVIDGSKDGYPELEEKRILSLRLLQKKKNSLTGLLIRDFPFWKDWKRRWRRSIQRYFPVQRLSGCMTLTASRLI